jgi:outer membrane protein OmpA-like peptidoglycan-associated protein
MFVKRSIPMFLTLLLFSIPQIQSQESASALLARKNGGSYSVTERSDWSRYDNGKYTGHVYREVRSSIQPLENADAPVLNYRGNFFVLEETLRDMRQSARAVNMAVPVQFQIRRDGAVSITGDRGFPSLRGFPHFPDQPLSPGTKWTAWAQRVIDPLNEGNPALVSFLAEYEYKGTEVYRDIPVYRITARYDSRHQKPPDDDDDFAGGSPLKPPVFQIRGNHAVDILLRVSDGLPLMMRDTFDDTYTWSAGTTVRFRGFILTFGNGTIPLNREAIISTVRTAGRTLPTDAGIDMTPVDSGLRLTVKDVRFAPDSDEFLPSENSRLEAIARVLKEAPDKTFLVEGHTAAIGNPTGEMELSLMRAKRMADELIKRGIPAERFIYKGWGGTKPLGDNATDEGRRLNRRVEITILE